MSLFNTANHYNVYLEIPDQTNFSWNYIYDYTIDNLHNFIKNLNINNEQSLIVLWGIGHKINVNDIRVNILNEWYLSIRNPMIMFSNTIYTNSPGFVNFPYQQIEFFQYLSKLSVGSMPLTINKNKKFFFASTKDYLSRRYILQSLFKNRFSDQGYIAYKCIDKQYTTELYDIDNLQLIQSAVTSIDHLLPIQGFDDSVEYTNIPKNIVSDAYLSIVTETFYTGPELFFSEKIFNSMLYNHFFVYLGPAHSLKHLKLLGFKTWSHIINESYDDIENSAERLYAVTNAINEFVAKPINEIENLYIENIDIINHNKNLVMATDINDIIVSAMQRAIAIKN